MPSFESPLPYRPDRSSFWPEAFYNMRVDGLPVHADSDDEIAFSAAAATSLFKFSGFNQAAWDGGNSSVYWSDSLPAGTDTSLSSSARRTWISNGGTATHAGKHLWFSGLRQGGATKVFGQYTILSIISQGDKPSVMWSVPSRELVQTAVFRADLNFPPECLHIVTWDLDDYELPNDINGNPSGSSASKIPIPPLQIVYQDLLDCGTTGDLGHMLGFVLYVDAIRAGHVWPARFDDGVAADGLAEGSIIRLKSDFDVAGLATAPLRALARTLQRYGMLLFDRGGHASISGVNDPSWPSLFGDDVFDLTDFERVDVSSVETASWERLYPLQPPAGTFRVGCAQTSGSVATKHETPTGKPLGMHRRFVSTWGQKASGSATKWQVTKEVEDAWTANRALHVSTKTPNWNAVAIGNHDAEITTLMTQLRDIRSCIWFSAWHEPENDLDAGLGTATDWRNMQLKFESIRVAVGADNVLIVPTLMTDTIPNGDGADWVITNTNGDGSKKFPVYGVDYYSTSFSTGPLDLRANTKWTSNISYLTSRGFDITLPEVGYAINSSGERNPNMLTALLNECQDPANRIVGMCWFDDGTNELGGNSSDPDDQVLDVFHTALTASYSYRGGARRGIPAGQVDSIRVTDLNPSITPPTTGEHTLRRRVAGTFVPHTIKKRVNGSWVLQAIRRISG